MRRRVIGQADASFEAVNVTPLIDVVMCLIVFFLIVGKLASDASAVRLPETVIGRLERAGKAVVISIAKGDAPGSTPASDWGGVKARVFVDGQAVGGENELGALLRDRAIALLSTVGKTEADLASAPVHVRADRDLPYGAVEPILRAVAKAGIPGVRLATQRGGGGS